jgi:hypothetical protein
MTPQEAEAARVEAVRHLRDQRDWFAERLADYESGTWEIGRLENGTKIDETQAVIDDLKRRIADLDKIIAGYEKRGRQFR